MDSAVSSSDILERSNYGLGEIQDEERICCRGKVGCRKRTCCPCVILAALFMNICMFLVLISLSIYYDFIEGKKHFFEQMLVIFTPFTVPYLLKISYGTVWFFKGRARKAFLPYYRMAMTANISNFLFSLPITFINISGARHG